MAIFQTQKFIEAQQAKGISDNKIADFLQKKGINPSQPMQQITDQGQTNFFERLKLGFGTSKSKEQQQALERQAGLKGKFDIGDIADIAGGIPSFVGFIGGTAVGGIPGGAVGAGLGETVRQTIGKGLGVREDFEPKRIATEGAFGLAGGLAGKALNPLAKFLGKSIKSVTKPFTKQLRIPEFIVGTERLQATKAGFINPKLQKSIVSGAFKEEDVAKILRVTTKDFQTKSFKAFQEVVEQTPKTSINKVVTIKSFRDIVRKELDLPEKGKFVSLLKGSPLDDKEANQILKVFKVIIKHRDYSKRGILNLRQKVDKFNKFGSNKDFAGSDKILNKLRSMMNDISAGAKGKKQSKLRTALDKATNDIDLINKLKLNIVGKNKDKIEVTANNVKALIKGLDDSATRQASLDLIKNLEQQSGQELLPLMQAFADSATIRKPITGLAGGLFTTTGEVAGRSSASIARGLGSIKNIIPTPGPIFKQRFNTATRVGLFEALRQSQQR